MKKWYEDSVGLRLTRAARLHRARAHTMLGEIGIHPGQENVLQVLLEDDGQPMTKLAAQLRVKPPTVTKMVSRMAAQGLVRRIASETDARSARVFLTDEGRSRGIELKKRWKRLEQMTMRNVPEKDRAKLIKLLMAVEASLDGDATAEADVDTDLDVYDETAA
ncbi:MarR family winged helix-turn-helix transcriptional regulator [Microbaculum marinisediminis]|uniref:MarR family transcriptional regulator n=1 Tax=Microbaculum marinisediminis TaxID=2931392 RepID=A0AAW5QX54_9HYPH|nr:MarR family transcriptional regulator [Microbaculum sp. A6E488]MCT8971562.1 MarR family transcriptional regulator [Microbaculum sp. A6E488]